MYVSDLFQESNGVCSLSAAHSSRMLRAARAIIACRDTASTIQFLVVCGMQGIGFAAGHSEPFEGAFHEKDGLQARFKRAEAPQDGQADAEEEPVSVRDRIRARVANAMREGKKHEKTEGVS